MSRRAPDVIQTDVAAPERLAPRVRAAEVAAMLNVTVRTVQGMAARGGLPGAAQIGKIWTFDLARLRRFIATRENQCLANRTSTNESPEASTGFEPSLGVSNAVRAYELAMSKSPGGYAISGSRRSKVKLGAKNASSGRRP